MLPVLGGLSGSPKDAGRFAQPPNGTQWTAVRTKSANLMIMKHIRNRLEAQRDELFAVRVIIAV